jgi:hypothetical protein
LSTQSRKNVEILLPKNSDSSERLGSVRPGKYFGSKFSNRLTAVILSSARSIAGYGTPCG